ncbi:MAG: FKBP-type peptidyl-prolyl cis-trans isomerase [Actinomycetota bacterium]
MRRRLALLTLLAIALTGACGRTSSLGDDGAPTPPISPSSGKPTVNVPDGPPPTELVINDLRQGEGPPAKDGDTVIVNYVGVLFDTGEEFGSSWESQPSPLFLGQPGVIEGWQQGLVGVKIGGQRELIIPSDLAYGPEGRADAGIPANAALIFVIDVVDIVRA